MHGTSDFANAMANTQTIEPGMEFLPFILERLFHPKVICSDRGGSCSRLEDIIVFLVQGHEQEELLMVKTGYPMFAAHKRKHKALLRTLRVMKHALVCGNYDNTLVYGFITEWTKRHAVNYDKRFGEFLKNHQTVSEQKKGY